MMSVSPYTMETLYRHGSIDYIPYDALTPVAPVKSYSSQGQNSLDHSLNSAGETQNLAEKQMQELQKMSQGPVTLYPKTQKTNINSTKLNNYNSSDTFSYSNSTSPLGEISGSVVDEIRNIKYQPSTADNTQDSFRASILSEEDKKGTQKPFESTKIWPKALISLAAIGLTIFALFKGGKAAASSGSSFWSKLNPKNWFK